MTLHAHHFFQYMVMDEKIMHTVAFDRVKDLRGIWVRVSDIEMMISGSKAYMTPKNSSYSETIRDSWLAIDLPVDKIKPENRGARHAFSMLSNLIIYDNLFVDALASKLRNIDDVVVKDAFGPFHDYIKFVDVGEQVYGSAAAHVSEFLERLRSCGNTLADDLFQNSSANQHSTRDFEHILQYLFNSGLSRDIPLSMIDTCNNSLQRLFLYFEIQKLSKVPLRQTKATIDFVSSYGKMLGTIARTLPKDPQLTIEHIVQKILNGNFLDSYIFDGPPLFKMILDEIKGSPMPISIASAAFNIRNKRESQLYRNWLWRYFTIIREHDVLKKEKHLREMKTHLDGMVNAGKVNTIWTGRPVSFGLSKIVSVSSIFSIRLPRAEQNDYIQFIGQWL